MPTWMKTIGGWIKEMLVGGDITISDNPIHVSVSQSGKKLVVKNSGYGTVNVQQINVDNTNKEQLLGLLKEQAFDKDIVFLQDDSKKILTSISELEKSPDISNTIRFFKGILSDQDLVILRSGLYIKSLREVGDPKGTKLKADITSRYGARGKNIVNLATAGYFESYIRPLYEEMSQKLDFSKEEFLEIYRVLVNELPFTIFVHAGMNVQTVTKLFNEKAERQIKYDVDEEVIAIHGYGRNAETVAAVRDSLRKTYQVTEESYVKGIIIITIKVYYKTKTNMPILE